jgi:hypothetical protein
MVEVEYAELPERVVGHEAGGVVQEEELPQPRPHQALPRLTAQLPCTIQ